MMNWFIVKTIFKVIKDIIIEFIHDEIYIQYDASQEIFINDKKNLWEKIIQKYLEKIKILHKDISFYYSWINGKMKWLNDIIDIILGKLLLNKSMKLWNFYLD